MATQTSATTTSGSARPPVTVGQSTHLDPGAYVRGTHAIALGENILVHPRAQLIAAYGPLSIGDNSVISEKCVIGGPMPASTTDANANAKVTGSSGTGSNPPTPVINQASDDDERDPVKTIIRDHVYIHPSSQIHAGATIEQGVLIEPHVTVLANVTIKPHAKICAGVTVGRDVEEWMVVQGNGNVKRRRKLKSKTGNDQDDPTELVESLRLKAMDKEREGTVALFRAAARTASLAKKK